MNIHDLEIKCIRIDKNRRVKGIINWLIKYISYLEQTYLISTLYKFSPKSRQQVRNKKYYAIDVALMDKRANAFADANLGWRLETLVYLEF